MATCIHNRIHIVKDKRESIGQNGGFYEYYLPSLLHDLPTFTDLFEKIYIPQQ